MLHFEGFLSLTNPTVGDCLVQVCYDSMRSGNATNSESVEPKSMEVRDQNAGVGFLRGTASPEDFLALWLRHKIVLDFLLVHDPSMPHRFGQL